LRIIEATHPYVACYKPNSAFYEAFGPAGLEALRTTLAAIPSEIPVILDVKRGDIDSTAKAYADAAFGFYGVDAVTLSPYMGKDSIQPFLEWPDRGVFVLCKTSNPGAPLFQDIEVSAQPFYAKIARESVSWSDRVGLVVAGNSPEALRNVRAASPKAWFLVPGIGTQGGNAEEAVLAGSRPDGRGLLVVAARSVAGADDPAAAARRLRDDMRRASEAARNRAMSQPVESLGPKTLQERFVKALIDTGCFKLGEFVLKSGKKSPFYVDLRKLISDPKALRLAAQAYASLGRSCGFDRLAGIPAAGLPLATATGLELSVPMIWPRMPAKEHGTGNRIEGAFNKGEKVLLLDDLITTGASKLEALEILRGEGLEVSDLIVLIERGKQGRSDMEKAGVRLHAFLHVREVFATCEKLGLIDPATRTSLENFVDSE
jgi:uridine monophosphate synthetase